MLISEIFSSIDGEARRAGELATFVRTVGCNLRCKYCFGPDSRGKYPLVTMVDGTKKPINEVEIGDEILTLNNKGEIVSTQIIDTGTRESTEYERLVFPNTALVVTPDHPFFVDGKWKSAGEMVVGDKCIKVADYRYALYEVINPQNLELLRNYTLQILNLYVEKCTGNMGEKNGNFNPDYKYRNWDRLKYMIRKGYCTNNLLDDSTDLVVHHLDGSHDNDSPDNLVIISRNLHNRLHARGYNFGRIDKNDQYAPLLSHTRSYGENYCHQLGHKVKTFVNITCKPYNTFLIDDIYVHNCDSKYTWEKDETAKEMTLDEIAQECIKLGNHNITFTGGEPLIQKEADELITMLACLGFDVSIETDGAVDFTMKPWFLMNSNNVWVCVDYKCYASGMTDKMLPFDKFARLRDHDVIKCVVGSKKDLELAYNLYKHVRSKGCNCHFYLSPVFGQIEGSEIVEFMKEKNMQGKVKFQLQIHKFIYPVEARGV